WGLMPGDYYVNAVSRGAFGGPFGGFGGRGGPAGPGGGPIVGFGGAGGGRAGFGVRGAGPAPGAPAGKHPEQVNYAATSFPGVPSVNEAKPVAVGLSQEVLDINFNMQLVRVSLINGHVLNPDGTPVTSGNVTLMIDNSGGRGNQIGMNYG